MPVMQTIRTVRGVKAVKIDSLWFKVDGKGKVWREGEEDWYPSEMDAENVIKAIEKEEIKILVKMGMSPPKAPAKVYVKVDKKMAGQRVKEYILSSDEAHTTAELTVACNCSRSVCDNAVRKLRRDGFIEEGINNGRTWISRPSKTWRRKLEPE